MDRKMDRRSFPGKYWSIFRMGLVALFLVSLMPLKVAAETKPIDKTKQAVEGASRESVEAAGNFFQRLNENGMQNWTRDEIVAWLIMALLVGSAAGMFTSMKATGLGKLGQFLLGLAGALVGCMLVRVGSIDYGWGKAVISYEGLVYSFGAALLFIVADRVIRRVTRKKKKKL